MNPQPNPGVGIGQANPRISMGILPTSDSRKKDFIWHKGDRGFYDKNEFMRRNYLPFLYGNLCLILIASGGFQTKIGVFLVSEIDSLLDRRYIT